MIRRLFDATNTVGVRRILVQRLKESSNQTQADRHGQNTQLTTATTYMIF